VMAFVVLYAACVLYPAPLRDLLMRIANTGVVRARWSAAILDECFRSVLDPTLSPLRGAREKEGIATTGEGERRNGHDREREGKHRFGGGWGIKWGNTGSG
jgi:hypothetical protein